MKPLAKLFVGSLVMAAMWAVIPAGRAAAVEATYSCNQQLVDCVTGAAKTLDCCVYAADDTTVGGYGDCADVPAVSAPTQRPPTVGKCLLTLNGTITSCNVQFAICKVKKPLVK
jgi:hypothetical protein